MVQLGGGQSSGAILSSGHEHFSFIKLISLRYETHCAFNMCSFWLVEALTRAGKAHPEWLDQARLLFERMLGYANHLGLYAEQTSSQGEALGNFPQAFTHLALISAAFNLDRTLGHQ